MKAIAIADLHIDIDYRFEDTKAVLHQIVSYAITNKIDQVWILGDIYDKKRPCSAEIVLFHQFIKSLTDHNIAIEMISGNHDIDKYQVSALQELAVLDLPGVTLHANPFVINFGKSKIYLGHFLVVGAKLGALNYSSKNEVTLKQILETPADLYLLGDVHKPQKLHSNPDVLYVGSIERTDFGERDEVKGFTLLEETASGLKYHFINLKTRSMIQIENNGGGFQDPLPDTKEAILKVKFNITKEQYRAIDEKKIKIELFPDAYSIKFEYNITREDRIRNANISEGCGPAKAFTNYAKEKELDQIIINAGLEIIEAAE